MAIHIIIDGYNFIRQSMSPRLLKTRDLQQEREFLVRLLAAWKRRRAHAVTVVFDGGRAPWDLPRKDVVSGIEVIFSPAGQTADTVIKEMAAREKEKALVVSSDREISVFVSRTGATTIDCAAFESRLEAEFLTDDEDGLYPDEGDGQSVRPASTRKKGPSFRLSKKQRQLKSRLEKL
ncbi:MAG: NYN domain-containing protein [Thermodesulfobacteriota bacterium]